MRIKRSDVSSMARYQVGFITDYARNVASFNSHQSAYVILWHYPQQEDFLVVEPQ